MATADDSCVFPGRNPYSWVLSARNSADDEWKVLWENNRNDTMRNVDNTVYLWKFGYEDNAPETFTYFRLEITQNQGAPILQLSRVEILNKGE